MTPEPRPPVNVCVVLDDDTIVPVQCRLMSMDSDGFAVWHVVDAPHPDDGRRIVAITIEILPPATTVVLSSDT